MRALLPTPAADLDDDDLAAAYAYPREAWVRANMVASADGAAAAEGGLSGGISGPADKRLFGVLRGLADAVLVGASTVRTEGYGPARPKVAFAERRANAGQRPAPVIAVVSGSLDLDLTSPLFTEATVRTIVLTTGTSRADRRAEVHEVADVIVAGYDRVEPGRALAALRERGFGRVLCEGGPSLLRDVLAGGLLDELCLTVSPVVTGGTAGRVVRGAALDPPARMRLEHLLEEDGFLFTRYVRLT